MGWLSYLFEFRKILAQRLGAIPTVTAVPVLSLIMALTFSLAANATDTTNKNDTELFEIQPHLFSKIAKFKSDRSLGIVCDDMTYDISLNAGAVIFRRGGKFSRIAQQGTYKFEHIGGWKLVKDKTYAIPYRCGSMFSILFSDKSDLDEDYEGKYYTLLLNFKNKKRWLSIKIEPDRVVYLDRQNTIFWIIASEDNPSFCSGTKIPKFQYDAGKRILRLHREATPIAVKTNHVYIKNSCLGMAPLSIYNRKYKSVYHFYHLGIPYYSGRDASGVFVSFGYKDSLTLYKFTDNIPKKIAFIKGAESVFATDKIINVVYRSRISIFNINKRFLYSISGKFECKANICSKTL